MLNSQNVMKNVIKLIVFLGKNSSFPKFEITLESRISFSSWVENAYLLRQERNGPQV